MATYHCSIKNGKCGNGKAHCDYILRTGSYANGTKKEELVYSQFGNLPSWAASPSDFFDRADLYERKNGNVYTEFEIALPNELPLEENIKLVQRFVEENVGGNKVYCFAIHEKMQRLTKKIDNRMRILCSLNALLKINKMSNRIINFLKSTM